MIYFLFSVLFGFVGFLVAASLVSGDSLEAFDTLTKTRPNEDAEPQGPDI
jgi:hypothetical protein